MYGWSKSVISPLLQAFPNLEKIDLTRQRGLFCNREKLNLMPFILENKEALCPKLKYIKGLLCPENEEYFHLIRDNVHLIQDLIIKPNWSDDRVYMDTEYRRFIKTIAENEKCESIELIMDDSIKYKILPDMKVPTVKTLKLKYLDEKCANEAEIDFIYAFNNLAHFEMLSPKASLPATLSTNFPFQNTLTTLRLSVISGLAPFLAELTVLYKLTLEGVTGIGLHDYVIRNETTSIWNTLEELNMGSEFVCNENNRFLQNFKRLKKLGLNGTFKKNYKYPLDCQFKDTLEQLSVDLQPNENIKANLSLFIEQFNKLSELTVEFSQLKNSFRLPFSSSVPLSIKHITFRNCRGGFLNFLQKLQFVETIIFDETTLHSTWDFDRPGPGSKTKGIDNKNYEKSIRKFFDPILNLRCVHVYTYGRDVYSNYSWHETFHQALQEYFMVRGIRYIWRNPEEGVIF